MLHGIIDVGHAATVLVHVPSSTALRFLTDPVSLGRWSLGCMHTRQDEDGLVRGTSMFDGSESCTRIDADEARSLVDYHVGSAGRLQPRISARVLPGEATGLPDTACYITLQAWRTPQMSEERWRRLCAAHDAEVWVIKALLEGSATDGAPEI